MSTHDEEFRQQCIKIQSSTGMDDVSWKAYFGNEKGLYGFITSREQSIKEQAEREARIDELEQRKADYREYYPRGSNNPYATQKCIPEAYIDGRISELKRTHSTNNSLEEKI